MRPDDGVEALVGAGAMGATAGGPVYFSDVVARPGDEADGDRCDFAGRRLAVNEPDSHSGSNVVLATLAERGVPVGGFAEVDPHR